MNWGRQNFSYMILKSSFRGIIVTYFSTQVLILIVTIDGKGNFYEREYFRSLNLGIGFLKSGLFASRLKSSRDSPAKSELTIPLISGWLETLNSLKVRSFNPWRYNRTFARWRRFTTTTRMLYEFFFLFNIRIPLENTITTATKENRQSILVVALFKAIVQLTLGWTQYRKTEMEPSNHRTVKLTNQGTTRLTSHDTDHWTRKCI